jgi:hypothetical protein
MGLILSLIQFLNLILTSFAIAIGIKFLSRLKENKILLIIPILSLIQILFSEVLKLANRRYFNVSNDSVILTNTYICLEYFMLIQFFWKIKTSRKEKFLILISLPITIVSLLFSNKLNFRQNLISIDTFLLLEGPIIIILALYFLVHRIKNKNLTNYIQEPNFIAAIGIFLSFLILWPTNIIQKFILIDPGTFVSFLFISNSISYLIFFSFLSYSFYATKK